MNTIDKIMQEATAVGVEKGKTAVATDIREQLDKAWGKATAGDSSAVDNLLNWLESYVGGILDVGKE